MKNTQHNLQHDDQKIIRTEAELTPADFACFLSFLKSIQPHFNDFCLVDGAFRSRTNDKASVVETGFPYFRKMNFNFEDIKKGANMLSALNKNSRIEVMIDNDRVTFTDKSQEIHLPSINNVNYLYNKFFSDDKMEDIFLQKVDPDRLLLMESFPKITISNIHKMLRELNSNSIRVTHVEDALNMVYFQISENNQETKTLNYQMKLSKPLLFPMKKGNYFNIGSMPFEFCKNSMSLKFYFTKDEGILTLFYNTFMNDLFVNIYARAALVDESTISR